MIDVHRCVLLVEQRGGAEGGGTEGVLKMGGCEHG